MRKEIKYENFLKIGLVQPIINEDTAWPKSGEGNALKMNLVDIKYIERQIKGAVNDFMERGESEKPDIVVLPELCISDEYFIEKLAKMSNMIFVTGRDFFLKDNNVKNIAEVFIPSKFAEKDNVKPSGFCYKFIFGKKYFSHTEEETFKDFGLKGVSCPDVYILDSEKFGRIGFAICADFFDMMRFCLYKNNIQHLFILALNRDVETFQHLAETISRTVFCNVVVCNTGHYGGSLVYTPYKDTFKRYSFLNKGMDMIESQVISIPVDSLIKFQKKEVKGKRLFKSLPPGYNYLDFKF